MEDRYNIGGLTDARIRQWQRAITTLSAGP
jgi:hypothetical protein